MIHKTQKSLTERAAEAVKKGGSSADLFALKREVTARIDELEAAKKPTQKAIEKAEGTGDVNAVRQAEQDLENLNTELRMLRRQGSDLAHAVKTARGEEAVKAAAEHEKKLAAARDKALQAQDLLQQAEAEAREVINARRAAAEIGERITFDRATIRELAGAIYPEGSNSQKQLMIDLGIAYRTPTAMGG